MKPITNSLSERAQLRFQILEKIFKQLGDEQSRIMLMHYRGYSPRDIAKALNISEPIVKNKLNATKQEARKLIQKYYQ
ncbi:sigma factor-like helix-turn-helix DNA-binding protein [Flavilitoribacter nigricans]|uniref:RNA polymerase sigma factor 70 region 4 type 2 domain-containing protein n=1 Tax=Flavilitoribacter nigricans (strain ATCC 23147 / DSM 23189 / NBRC 102662 / NCIMB 1420 / SS-2) TaxID=1122177 RepID=A0A2D0N5C6_FLAN2|nr:sigma factor-like helix-turn-helix DNA-binding protein [Flavilitoribacter nigricans]PHN03359.1 hypothetical protein CRP01_27120 [Flavilitoribacter nigricans DSM 23189 = NBRC 102662]